MSGLAHADPLIFKPHKGIQKLLVRSGQSDTRLVEEGLVDDITVILAGEREVIYHTVY